MIDVVNVQNYESGDSQLTAVVYQKIRMEGKDFENFKKDFEELIGRYNTKKG
ncbi:hypothetical protein HNP86_001694 [Methanococcus maripaludis]|uniref:Uncharacterized protein n=1 Tax=Methanococcus maripaludis TaxID=39152 RepID=A0A7J9NW49_METMI|nr:hypothetical protein [Methanococcus maripaludis]MBA2851541.1 hypothetical protein [Methanococcus maripaludis]